MADPTRVAEVLVAYQRHKGPVVSEVEWSALVGSARCVVPESDARKYADGGWVVESRGVTPWRAAAEETGRG